MRLLLIIKRLIMFTFTDKQVWARECIKRGAANHIAEITTYDELGQEHMQEYAVMKGNSPLVGVWHPIKKEGHIFAKPKQHFSTKDRKFVQEKMTAYA